MTHTQGPWNFYRSFDASPHRVYISREVGQINIPHHGYTDPDGKISDQQASNARLIAAAPELLTALKYARRFMKPEDHDTKYLDGVIAQAEGGEE